ncbi:prevent-host-death protein [Micromonospora sp. NPDC005205]|uniref:type II toxin-antitoxin system Phd/YefM family antitoxin n=1 Tax=Micromonospora sp. NPDC005205 TaxID=3156714 RepID=UPI0033AE1BA2
MAGEAAAQFNLHDAKTNPPRITERVEHGEETVVSRAGSPAAEGIAIRRTTRIGRGSLRGPLDLTANWDSDEVNDEVARCFGLSG